MWDADDAGDHHQLRGLCGEEIVIHAADRDLHSGFYGSAAANPNHVLAKIIADLRDADGRVTLPGFYDGVPELPDALRESWAKLGFERGGVPRRGRPLGPGRREGPLGAGDDLVAADLRGQRHGRRLPGRRLQDGDPGAGAWRRSPSAWSSTRIRTRSAPPSASTSRRALPADCTVEFHEHGAGPAVAFDTSGAGVPEDAGARSPTNGASEAAFVGGGGSIPVATLIKNKLGIEVVMVGFGLADDRIHSPNEKYDLKSFHKGIRSWARVLDALAR